MQYFPRWATVVLSGLTLIATSLVGQPVSAAAAESNNGVRIMPLGASITDGFTVPGGYRVDLWQKLVGHGNVVDFVGSAANGPSSLGDHDHEGHSGWRIDNIDANVVGWLRASDPHTVLLHIGTNDVLQDYDLANAPARMSGLIDHIVATSPSAEVFVAAIAPLGNPVQEVKVKTFNAALPDIIGRKVAAGKHVHLVDMHAVVSTADLSDGIHPTAAGYGKMAQAWYGALLAVPSSLSPSLVNPQSGRCLDVTGAATAAGAKTEIWDCHGRTNQQWSRTTAGELRAYGDRCLDVTGGATTSGSEVIIWNCTGGDNQKWVFRADGAIVGVGSGKCLDVASGATANGSPLRVWDCNGTGAQTWSQR